MCALFCPLSNISRPPKNRGFLPHRHLNPKYAPDRKPSGEITVFRMFVSQIIHSLEPDTALSVAVNATQSTGRGYVEEGVWISLGNSWLRR